MSVFTLYGEPDSGSFTPEALLRLVGADVKLIDLDLPALEQRRPEYLAINPTGRIPALLLPEGLLVTESAAILLAIDERFPEAQLLPPVGSVARANALRWIAFIGANPYGAVSRWDYPERFSTDPAHAPAIREKAIAHLRWCWTMVEAELAPAPYCLGDAPSALDLYLVNISRWIVGLDWLAATCPRIWGVHQRLERWAPIAPVWLRHFGNNPVG
jgi:GST-like protein